MNVSLNVQSCYIPVTERKEEKLEEAHRHHEGRTQDIAFITLNFTNFE
jgi:hypothetical protein